MDKAYVLEEREGRKIAVYANGMERDVDANRIVKPPNGTQITKENASAMNRKRQEKAARLLRQAIATETADKLVMSEKPTAPEAVAAAGAILWRDIVLADPNDDNGPKAYPRDRLEAWEKLGKHAGILAEAKQAAVPAEPNLLERAGIIALAAELARRMVATQAVGAEIEDG